MPRLEYFLIVESISVDQSTNRVSVFNILEEAHFAAVHAGAADPLPPGTVGLLTQMGIPQMVAVSSWILSAGDQGKQFRVSLRVHFPGQKEPVQLHTTQFTAERARQRVIQVIIGFQVNGPGDLRFEVLLDDMHQAWHTITVQVVDTAPPLEAQSETGNNVPGDV